MIPSPSQRAPEVHGAAPLRSGFTDSPDWSFDEETFARAAACFDNPDYVSIVIHLRTLVGSQYRLTEHCTRKRDERSGPILRVFSPTDPDQVLKPFVFLDYVDITQRGGPIFKIHPHSGIVTITVLLSGDMCRRRR